MGKFKDTFDRATSRRHPDPAKVDGERWEVVTDAAAGDLIANTRRDGTVVYGPMPKQAR